MFVVPGCVSYGSSNEAGNATHQAAVTAAEQQNARVAQLQGNTSVVDSGLNVVGATAPTVATRRVDLLHGEETRVMGSLVRGVMNGARFRPRRIFCLVGMEVTKWIGTHDGEIHYFRTYTTPAVFGALMGSGLAGSVGAAVSGNGGAEVVSNATVAAEMGLAEGRDSAVGGGNILHKLFYITSEPLCLPNEPKSSGGGGGSGSNSASSSSSSSSSSTPTQTQLTVSDRPPLLAGMLVGAETSEAIAYCRVAGEWAADETIAVTLLACDGGGSKLLAVYQMAIQQLGCYIDSGGGGEGEEGGAEVEHKEVASGLFALANAVRASSEQHIAAKQQQKRAEEMAAREAAMATATGS
eukprot:COSAG05_NODE_897_length_6692_cov_5.453966_7_plen_353_part_00